jgi:arsenate reductase
MDRPYNVLFLCTGNSARSILGEAVLNHAGKGRFKAYSAGSHPKGAVHPTAIEMLAECGLPTKGLRSKSWDEFAARGAPELDFVFTVCDDAAGESCPAWPGQPMTAHWGIEDPAKVTGPQQKQAFLNAMTYMQKRIALFTALPIEALDEMTLSKRLRDIGREPGASEELKEPLAPGA